MNFISPLLEVLQVTAPIFIVIGTGYLIKKIKLINDDGVTLLTRFAYNIGLPALLLLNITEYKIGEILNVDIIKVIYSAYGLYFVILMALSFLLKRSKKTRGAFFVSSFRVNMAFVGLPIVWTAFGGLALVKASLVIAFLVPVNIIVTIIVFKVFNNGEEKFDLKKLARSIVTDPVIVAVILGIILSYLGVGLPGFMHSSLNIISGMTVAIALISIGASFKFNYLKNDMKLASYISFNKLIFMPLIVYFLATNVFRIEIFDRNVIVALFATPLAVAAYIMARELRSNYSLVASALILTTLISVLTISGWLLVLRYF